MRKPKDFGCFWISNQVVSRSYIAIDTNYVYLDELPQLIKWLESVQKYNEFNTKKKVKPTTTELLTTTKISRKVK